MMYYEVKLINPETKEIYFECSSHRPQLPTQDILDRHKGAIIVIRTTEGINNQ